MKDPLDNYTQEFENMNTKIADLANSTGVGIDAYKVVYQFVGNNHMLRNNSLIFFCKDHDIARNQATAFLKENNVPWYKILSVQKA